MADKIPALFNLALALFNPSKPLGCFAVKVWFYKIKEMPFDAWELGRRMAMDPKGAHSACKTWKTLDAADLTPILNSLIVPTMVVFGKQDGTVPVEQAHPFKEKLPAVQLAVIDGCGHLPMYEKFDTFLKQVRSFLT